MKKSFLQTSSVFLIYMLSFSFVYATKTPEFIDLLANKIFNECGKQEIFMKADSVAGGVVIRNNLELKDINVKDLETFSRNLSQNEIQLLVRILTQSEPYIIYSNYPKTPTPAGVYTTTKVGLMYDKNYEFSNSGLGILSCGGKMLDINGDQYYWDKKLFELPKVENNYTFFENGKINLEFNVLQASVFGGLNILGGLYVIVLIRQFNKQREKK